MPTMNTFIWSESRARVDGPLEVGATVWVTVTVGAGVDSDGVETTGEGEAEPVAVGTELVSDGEGDVAGKVGEGCNEYDPPILREESKESHNYATNQIPSKRPRSNATAMQTTVKKSERLTGERNSTDLPATIENSLSGVLDTPTG
jgi:hypothetical protein